MDKKEYGHSRPGYLNGCRCNECVSAYNKQKEYMRKWESEHRAERTEYQRNRAATDPNINEKRKASRAKNKDKISKYNREYRLINLEKINARCKKNRLKNRDEINRKLAIYLKHRYQTDPLFKLANTLRTRINSVLKRGGWRKASKTERLIGCTPKQLKEYLESLFEPGMSWEDRSLWHIDHIKPCFAFDLSDPEQQKLCFHWSNLRPLWKRDNLSKSSTHEGRHHCNQRKRNLTAETA